MITVYPILRQHIKQAGVSWFDLAAATGMSLFSLHLKMFGIRQWTFTDGVRLCAFFRTPDMEQLFLRNNNKQQFLESQGENGNV